MIEGVLWTPSQERIDRSELKRFEAFLAARTGLRFESYMALWQWSIRELETFWDILWAFYDLPKSAPYDCVLKERKMPGGEWFPGAKLNLTDQLFRHVEAQPNKTAIISHSETFGRREITYAELEAQVASLADHLRDMGVGKGDRVVAVLPNCAESMVAFLATISLGAIWSLCAPDMGHVAVIDRFKQIAPKVLITQDNYVFAGKHVDRSAVITEIAAGLPSLEHRVLVPTPGQQLRQDDTTHNWADLISRPATLTTAQLPFEAPLWVVYSSGTTGNPKPIVHGHIGALLEVSKTALHEDLTPTDRFCWLTSSGWIMWNAQIGMLLRGGSIVMIDGAANYPDFNAVWKIVSDEDVTFFGAGAAFHISCMKAGINPAKILQFEHLRSIASTGSPLSEDAYGWLYESVKSDMWLAPISGGTDLLGAFVLGNVCQPVIAGEMQVPALGNAVRAFDPSGNILIDEVGELVCTEPLPSMPLYFWGDEDGSRLHGSYFDTYPGIWTHGDWISINEAGASVIYGRSDATINRKGLRLGSSEIYSAVEGLDEILDSLVIDLEFLGRESFMPLFVVPSEGHVLDDALRKKINAAIATSVSPRFAPNAIEEISEVPRTLSGKKLEVPVKKLLLGGDPANVVNRDSMSNPESFDYFVAYAKSLNR